MHIGLIGGIGPSSTEYYYRHLVNAHNAAERTMELTIAHADIKTVIANMLENQAQRQADIFLKHVSQLKNAGADLVAVTSLGGHFCIEQLEAISPLPVLNLIPILNDYFVRQGLKRIGILGTAAVMESKFYGGVSSVDIVVPIGEELGKVSDYYLSMASQGHATAEQRSLFFEVGQKMCQIQGAEAIVLAGTDLFLAFDGQECGFPVIDAALVHVEALLHASQ